MKHWKNLTAGALAALLAPALALAIDLSPVAGFNAVDRPYNSGGGLSYLPDGDLLVFSNDFANGPTLSLVDANGDGKPAQPQALVQFDSSTFPDFVQVSPGGKFALFGVSGASSSIYRVDLTTNAVQPLFNAPGNFDFAFIDDDKGYLSSNPGGFDPSQPNVVSLVTLSAGPSVKPVLNISSTPSGTIATTELGDLYYVKSTFLFPAPAKSFHLFKFSAAQLAAAATGSTPLGESDTLLDVPLDGGFDLVYRNSASSGPELFLSMVGSQIFRFKEGMSAPEVFLSVLNDPTLPSISALSTLRPFDRFDATGPARGALAASLTTDFFSTFTTLEVRPVTFDTDGDNVADVSDLCPEDPAKTSPLACGCGAPEYDTDGDGTPDCIDQCGFDPGKSSPGVCGCGVSDVDSDKDGKPDCTDSCPNDPAKLAPGICGCGAPDVDSNSDGIVDCGSPRAFGTNVSPIIAGQLSGTVLLVERFDGNKSKYKFETRGPLPKTKLKSFSTKSNVLDFSKLKKGTYFVRYRVSQKIGRKTVKSAWSQTILITRG